MPDGVRKSLLTVVLGGLLTLLPAAPAAAQDARTIQHLIDSLRPYVEGATRLTFDTLPRVAVQSRAEMRAYLDGQMARPEALRKLRADATAYQLFGLLADTAGYERLVGGLYGEQVAGYYDPPTRTMVAVAGATPGELREVLAHELVHALQDRHTPLDSIRFARWDEDRLAAAQAVVEGQAMLTTLRLAAPGFQLLAREQLWTWLVAQMKQRAARAGTVSARAPLLLTEGLSFPYIKGAEFLYWWNASPFGDTLPFGPRLPASTEQILHPDRYAAGDAPIALRFLEAGARESGAAPADSVLADSVLAEDVLGEFEIQVLAAQLAGARRLGPLRPIGWGGDRYRVYATPGGGALVWMTVWDDEDAAERFRTTTGRLLLARRRAGYRGELVRADVDGRAGVRYVFAPEGWRGWQALPVATIAPPSPPRASR